MSPSSIGIISGPPWRVLKRGAASEDGIEPRKGMPSPGLSREEFRRRYLHQFVDPAFDGLRAQVDAIEAAAWGTCSRDRRVDGTC